MDIKTLGKITKWMESTDLSELSWKKGWDGFDLKFLGDDPAVPAIHSPLAAIFSPAVGIYRFSAPGKSSPLCEGMKLKSGQELGYVELGRDKKPVKTTRDGYLRVLCVEDGKPVQYGQPLFFMEPV
jgi:acetyl-CoA carboxylase biotin carboxyl carrier protein